MIVTGTKQIEALLTFLPLRLFEGNYGQENEISHVASDAFKMFGRVFS